MKSDRDIGSLSPTLGAPATCEACGKEFTCGASLAACWCSEIKVSDETRAEFSERYERCLCRECLEKNREPITVISNQ